MLPRTAVDDVQAARPRAFDDEVTALVQECGGPALTTAIGVAAAFEAWYRAELGTRGWNTQDQQDLARGARDQVEWTAVLRLCARDSWLASAGDLGAELDVFVMGSVGRGEASRSSDFDFLFVGQDAAELDAAGVPSDVPVDLPETERARGDALRYSPWWNSFYRRSQQAPFGYELPQMRNADGRTIEKPPDIFVVAAAEFESRATLSWNEGYVRHLANLGASRSPLRESARTTGLLAARVPNLTRFDVGQFRGMVITRYLDKLTQREGAHEAHAVLSQVWQAVLAFALGPDAPKRPYWQAPLMCAFAPDDAEDWARAVRYVAAARRTGNSFSATPYLVPGANALLRAAESIGLNANGRRRIESALRRRGP